MALVNINTTETTTNEVAGDTGLPNTSLYLEPFEGYSISKDDITVGELPVGISNVTLLNTSVPYTASNQVRVIVQVDPTYTMPSSNTVLTIPLSGNAYFGTKEYVDYHFKIRTSARVERPVMTDSKIEVIPFSITATPIGTDVEGNLNTCVTEVSSVEGALSRFGPIIYRGKVFDTVSSFSGSVVKDVDTVVGQITVEAGSYSGVPFRRVSKLIDGVTFFEDFEDTPLHIDGMPGLSETKLNPMVPFSGRLFLRPKSQELDYGNLHKSVVYDVIYKNTEKLDEAACIDTTLEVNTKAVISHDYKISMLDVGKKHVNPAGETRVITVYGTPGATFDLQIKSDAGKLLVDIEDGEIPDVRRNAKSGLGVMGKYVFRVEFEEATSNTSWNVYLRGTNNSANDSLVPDLVETYILYQYTRSNILISNSTSNGNIVRTAAPYITYKGKADSDVEEMYNKVDGTYEGIKFTTPIKWTLTNAVGQTYTITKANPVLSDFTNTDSTTNGGTIVRAPAPFTVTGGGTGTAVIEGALEISYIGKDDVTLNMNLDNILTLS